MASGDTLAVFDALGGRPPDNAFAPIDFRSGAAVLDFEDGSATSTAFQFMLPSHYTGGAIELRLLWVAESATSGAVVWSVAATRIEPGASSIDSPTAGPSQSLPASPNAVAGVLVQSTLTLTAVDAGNPTAGDLLLLQVERAAADAADTMAGDAELIALEVREG